ncbi:hypothetical protein CERSUDRAFT_91707 [Gelatoporia subvermispora B]|uniref:non-specific serine/threonine protein kinase n=1 Tax=Ceriporiopsis subvermispora (strain B) TaxID=914234 RepID=M2R980_CERS8|nr:hypothetical protein CERSUDRAFT_91707 [Gelatoporia subvermispora B]
MLGGTAKAVKITYGRRAQRIASASESRHSSKSRAASPMEAHTTEVEEIPSSPDVSPLSKVAVRKAKIKASPSRSPHSPHAKRRSRIPVPAKPVLKSKLASKSIATKPKIANRTPLSHISTNAPASPAIPPKIRKQKSVIGKGISLKPISLFVDVDIIVLDKHGRRLSYERRVSRSDVQASPINMRSVSVRPNAADKDIPEKATASRSADSDEELLEIRALKVPKGGSRRRPIVVSSDEEDSEEEDINVKLLAPNLTQDSPVSQPRMRSPRKPRHRNIIISPSPTPPPPASPPPPAEPTAKPSRHGKCPVLSSENRRFVGSTLLQEPAVPTKQHIVLPIPSIPSLQPLPSSRLIKTRQLTPIKSRQGRSSLFPAPPSPPSPTTPTILDLSLDFSELALSPSTRAAVEKLELREPPPPSYLQSLLAECSQTSLHEFSAFIELFPLDPIVHATDAGDNVGFQKIGEASYSEVFGIGDVVLKVIPLRDEERYSSGEDDPESPAPSDAQDVLKEMVVTRAMGEMCEGFVKLLRTYVVRGKYPSLLLELWDEYNERKGSESIRPDTFTASQCYAIIVLPNGGPDLEAYTFEAASRTGWRKACSLFWQVVRTLAKAEDLVSFEHRDLHWGQILIKNVPAPSQKIRGTSAKKLPMDDVMHGVEATIIDLGLARMNSGEDDEIHWTPFDEAIFEGEGDYQFDVYRMMRVHNGGSWGEYRPLTNVMWLHYLAMKLLNSKRLRSPTASKKNTATISSAFYSEAECYQCLVEVEGLLGDCVAAFKAPTPTKKGRRKTQALTRSPAVVRGGPQCATEVLRLAIDRGWVAP